MGVLETLAAALSTGIAVGCLALFLFRVVAGIELERRTEFERRIPLFFRLAMPFLPLFRPLVRGKTGETWSEIIAPRILMAGYGEVFTPSDFVALKLVFLGIGFFFLFLGIFTGHIIICLILGVMLMMYPTLWLSAVIKKRHISIMRALPNVLDLLTLSVESGRDLLSSLRDILTRRRMDPLGEELTRTFQEIQFGRKRSDALRDLSNRVRQPDLTATVNAILQAEELGVSVANLLRIQGDVQRGKRFNMAEKLANQAAVKIIFPIVCCILPAVFLILLSPLFYQVAQSFF